MMCIKDENIDEPAGHHAAQGIAMMISSVFLSLTILAHLLLPKLLNLQGFTVVCQSFSLMVHFITLSVIKVRANESNSCKTLAIIAYYFFESSFAWLAVMSFDVYLALSGLSVGQFRRQINLRMIGLYSAFGWGLPGLLILIALLIDNSDAPYYILRPYIGIGTCWLYKDPKVLATYLYGPASIFLVINLCFFILLAKKLYIASNTSVKLSPSDEGKGKERMWAILKLFILMGVTWIFEIISFAVKGSVYIWYLTDFLNILLSVFIFFMFIFKRRVLDMFGLQYKCIGNLLRERFSWEPMSSASRAASRKPKTSKVTGMQYSVATESVAMNSKSSVSGIDL